MTITTELPDFEEMYKSIEKQRNLSLQKTALEIEIKRLVSSVTRTVFSDSSYYDDKGKPRSMAFVEKAYLYTGLDDEVLERRKQLASIDADLEHEKMRFYLNKTLIEVWRTEQANKRLAVI